MRNPFAGTATFLVYGTNQTRIRAIWRILLPILAGFLALNLTGTAATALGVDRGKMMLASFSGATLVSIALLVIAARYLDKRPISDYGYHRSHDWWLDSIAGLILGMLIVALTFLLAHSTGSLQVTNTLIFDDTAAILWLFVFLIGFVGVTFYEEFLFRGLFITNAVEGLTSRGQARSTATILALLASVAGFALIHLPSALAQNTTIVFIAAKSGLLGGLLGVAYILTGELAFPMGLHLGVNYALMNIFGLGAAGYDGIPSILTVQHSATGLWSASHGLPILVATLASYAPVLGWIYWRHNTLSLQQSTPLSPVNPDQ